MGKWQWNTQLETGIDEIDEQHKELFKRIDRLELAVYKGTTSEELKKTVEYLTSYLFEHLDAEEKILRDCSYPDLAEHIKQHKEFRSRCAAFITQYNETGPDNYLAIEIEKLVTKWCREHILKMDMAYVPYVKKEVDYL